MSMYVQIFRNMNRLIYMIVFRDVEVLRRLAAEEAAVLPKELRDLARMGCDDININSCIYVFTLLIYVYS